MRMQAMLVGDVTPRQRSGRDWCRVRTAGRAQVAGTSSLLIRTAPLGSPG